MKQWRAAGTGATPFCDLVAARLTRRGFLRGGVALAAAATAAPALAGGAGFGFTPLAHGVDARHHVAAGHQAAVLLRWGDGVLPGAPAFDPARQSAQAQAAQFGYNNDFIGYLPLAPGADESRHGLLCINHEYADAELMFPGLVGEDGSVAPLTRRMVEIEMAATGGSIVEVARGPDGAWRVVPGSRYARRIAANATAMALSGPAAGHDRLRTSADASGKRVIGTLANCSGGMTPWGTWLTAEENFQFYFASDIAADTAADEEAELDPALAEHPERRNYHRLGIPRRRSAWHRHEARWNIEREPNEANRFGWVVEIDPRDPAGLPVKRTALGRFSHEGATCHLNGDGRVVVYSGDDASFEYFYRFVSARAYDPAAPAANRDLLDDGTLSVARFDADGGLAWLPLAFGQGPLTPANGFHSQGDIAIETRRAADLVGATPMDRPEGVAVDGARGRVYLALTHNKRRGEDRLDALHRRAKNSWGQIVELAPPGGDHAAARFRWDIVVACGDPADPAAAASWHPDTPPNGWFAGPDNLAVDPAGRLWVATDQGRGWAATSGSADGLWALETAGPRRGLAAMLFRAPVGAEVAGPCFTPDGESLFLSVQHPAADGTENYPGFERNSTFEDPATRWPDFDPALPPRPAVLAITRDGGGRIG
jgi:secreted PhoX family phosphatase